MGVAGAVIAASVVGAGAQIGSAAASGGGGGRVLDPIESLIRPQTDPNFAASSFDALLGLGLFDPSIFDQASPIERAIGQFMAQRPGNPALQTSRAKSFRRVMEAHAQGIEPKKNDVSRAKGIFNFLGLTPQTLLKQEENFNRQVDDTNRRIQESKETADRVRGGRLAGLDQIAALTSLPNIEDLKGQELERLLREINRGADEAQQDILTRANAAGFNPGRALGDIEEFRFDATQDADLDALSRALALIGGQTDVATGLQNLLTSQQTNSLNVASLGFNAVNNQPAQTTQQFIPSNNALGPAIANAGSLLAAGGTNAARIVANAPATSGEDD